MVYEGGGVPLVSLIISNYNGIKYVKKCLESCLNMSYPNYEIIFVDDCSTDGSFEFVKEFLGSNSRVKIIKNEENMGYVNVNNIGFKHANGDYIVFLNNDTEVSPLWLNEIVKVMEADPTIGAAQPKILNMRNRKRIDSLGAFTDPLGYVYPNLVSHEVREVLFAVGTAIIVRRSAIKEALLGGLPYDPDYVNYYEDFDLCWRIRLAGHRIVCVPTSVIYHDTRMRSRYDSTPFWTFHITKNQIMNMLKNYSLTNMLRYVPLLLILESAKAFIFFRSRPRHNISVLKAILWIFRNLRSIWKKRLMINRSIRKVNDSAITQLMENCNFIYLYRMFKQAISKG